MVGDGAGRVRRRGDQGRASPARAIPCARGATASDGIGAGVEERQPQQALRHPRPAPGRGPGAVPRAARRERRARRRATGRARSSAGASTTSRSTPRHPHVVMLHISGYGKGGPKSDRPGLRHPGRGHERLRPRHRPARRAADPAAVHAGRRRGRRWPRTYAVMMALYHRDVHGGTGQLIDVNLIEPLARLIESSTAVVRPARGQPGPGRQPARRQRAPQRLPHRRRASGWPSRARRRPSPMRVYRAIDRPDLAEDPDYVDPGPAPGPRRARSTSSWPTGCAERTLDEAMDGLRARPR